MVPDKVLSPEMTCARLEALKDIKVDDEVSKVALPEDIIYMSEDTQIHLLENKMRGGIPWKAYHSLWKYGISKENIPKYQIGWSPSWKRLIIPLFEYGNFGSDLTYKLVGWTGRNINWVKGDKYPKWLTRTKKGKRRFFMAPGKEDIVVLVEDPISAMKVTHATGFTSIALLTTSVSDDLMRWLRGKTVYLWLDGNMLAHAVKTVGRMRDFGLNTKRIYTTKDPKDYNTLFILDCIRRKTTYDKTIS
jgi:hypothetical protein